MTLNDYDLWKPGHCPPDCQFITNYFRDEPCRNCNRWWKDTTQNNYKKVSE